ncbi:hypothetical protein TWF751_002777 [Orbilia oligospora]|nr:hypothetical protein TWF751_002777 [Orbilia oligospora]
MSTRFHTQPFKMLIPKADRKKIHEYLFRGEKYPFRRYSAGTTWEEELDMKIRIAILWNNGARILLGLGNNFKENADWNLQYTEGVMVAKKDYNLPKHTELDVKNLFVIKACQSLTSRGYLKTQFSWQYYYYTLTPAGLDYLREWLHLPSEIVPATHVKQQRSTAPPRGMMGGDDRRERRGDRGDRDGYRRRDKEGGAPGEFKPEFRGGFGRGRGGAPPAATQ